MYTQCTPTYTEVYNRCTQVYKGLFPLAVALVDEAVGFLRHVLFEEMRVPGDDGLEVVIEHDSSRVEITCVFVIHSVAQTVRMICGCQCLPV